MMQAYNTVPKHDYLGLFHQDNPGEAAAQFLGFDKGQVSKSMGVPKGTITYDKKMPKEVSDRLREIANVCELVAEHFDGDKEKTLRWFQVKNPLLGGVSPKDMISFGRYRKLINFIQTTLAGNFS